MVLKYNPLLVPPPVSSSDEEPSDSENDVSDRENDVADSENDVVDSDSDNDVSETEGEENDVDSGDDDVVVVEDSEDEQPIGLLKKSKAGASSSKTPTAGASSSKAPTAGASSSKPAAEPGSESNSDGGSDEVRSVSSPDSDGFTVRQIVLKREKQVVAGTARRLSGKKPARSGPSGSEAEKKRKRKKVDGGDGAERSEKKEVDSGEGAVKSEKRALFQRLWSEEDEIALLQGLGEYERQKGTDPFYEMDGFFEFIKGSIHIRVTQTQLVNKARRMRRKFVRNAMRGKDGKDPSFKRPHDRRAYEVSKTIWGDGKMKIRPKRRGRPFGTSNRVASRKREVIKKEDAPQNTQEEKGGEDFWARYPCLRDSIDSFPSLPEWGKKLMMEKLIETPEEKLNELEGRWKELGRAVCELHLSHLQLIKDQAKVVHEAMTSDSQ